MNAASWLSRSAPGRWLAEAGEGALSLLYPPACAVCGEARPHSPFTHLCHRCVESLPFLGPPYCQVCGEWFASRAVSLLRCANCGDRRFEFEFAFAPLRAQDQARELVHQFKYEGALWLRVTFGQILASALRGVAAEPRLAGEAWTLVPVPLHPRRLRERQFNQALEISLVVHRLTGLPVQTALARTRYTTIQATLDRRHRLENLRHAFRPAWRERRFPSLRQQAVLLIDDVFTSGATAHECARVLKSECGARRVAVLTIARG